MDVVLLLGRHVRHRSFEGHVSASLLPLRVGTSKAEIIDDGAEW